MTKREAAIVSAYTGYLIADFGELQAYLEDKQLNPYSFTDEQIREACKEDFIGIIVED